MTWNGNIHTARESRNDSAKEGPDGNYSYNNSKTYGQSDYTVREGRDGTFDVYIQSDSKKGHSHDVVDENGNLLNHYHDTLLSLFSTLSYEELDNVTYATNEDCIKSIQKVLKK